MLTPRTTRSQIAGYLGFLLMSLAVSSAPLAQPSPETMEGDSRRAFTEQSPNWLRAVGRLRIPGIKHVDGRRNRHLENCSATLIAKPGRKQADTIVTAWHCLEYYSDLSQNITFTLLPNTQAELSSVAYRLADGGGMHADWALLRLFDPIDHSLIPALEIIEDAGWEQGGVTMAGYSSDPGLGKNGATLTYDMNCELTEAYSNAQGSSCLAYKGASGGAVVAHSSGGKTILKGVISQGDGLGVSTFVPLSSFRNMINLHLR